MRPARILLLVIALLAGGLAAYLATRGGAPATVEAPVATVAKPSPAAQILVAKTAIGVGQRLSPGSVEWQAWPQDAVRAEYITIALSPDAPAKITNAVARYEFFPGEPIREEKLVHSNQGFLSAVLEPGMRGVSVQVTAASGSGGFIIPNDRVDVVVTDASQGATSSRTILNDVKVLAIGTRLGQTGTTGTPGGDPADPKSQIFTTDTIATLELDPGQAEKLINATALGKVSLVLRSVADFGKTQSATGSSSDNQTVNVIRFGKLHSFTSGSSDQGGSALNAAAIVPQLVPPTVSITTGPAALATPAIDAPAAPAPAGAAPYATPKPSLPSATVLQ